MTKENFTSINVIIDRSGSMSRLTSDTIGNFNKFLAEQKNVPGDVVFTLCTFNHTHDLVHDFVKLASVSDLDTTTYYPMGNTALLDAMGVTIDSVGQKLATMPEEERPSKVIFLVITDGEENASRTYTRAKIKEMVTHQQEKYNWEFVFMGANIDAIAEGGSLGVAQTNSMNYVADSAGLNNVYKSVSENMTRYRSSTGHVRGTFFTPDTNKNKP